ncbi:hypothetical protein MB14_13100 [Roseivirga ehrenbergii]|uniref:RNA polymerase sigma-70 region 2 domain-containing protein n=2 Tax=Roseivirga ehrenbergii (strain DSM 102268 / JCM 13514 / KCTC 12282 / NCIMB 14502 / KMM 6017) TaxID=279360 RepID=A0A150XRZ8_ROSEK|nr:hypothetical protein MB14_13100 [Roseivirga ehrenbergii]
MTNKSLADQLLSTVDKNKNAAFKYLYAKYYATCQSYVLKNSGTEADAADVFQDTLVVFYLKLKKEPNLNLDIGAYLFGINRNIWLKKIKKSSLTVFEEIDNTSGFQEEVVIYENQIIVREVLNKIDKGCSELLIDFYYRSISMREISEKYKLASEKVAKNKKYRCLQKLIAYVNKNKIRRTDFSNE